MNILGIWMAWHTLYAGQLTAMIEQHVYDMFFMSAKCSQYAKVK